MYAIGKVYSESRVVPLLVGSVKTNIGHCESAAGIASLIKVILCIQNKAIPPHLNLKNLNPRINLEKIPAKIPLELTPWTAPTKIAAVSSFSMSATNAHAIVQEPPSQPLLRADSQSTEMITLSAKSEEALAELKKRYIDFLKLNGNPSLTDIVYATNTGRAHLQHRLAVVASDTNQLLSRLEKDNFIQGKASTLKSKVAFLFTGQGSQHVGMTKGMCEAFPAFRKAMDRCEGLFQNSLNESLRHVLYKSEEFLDRTLFCQPVIFCIEYCLSQLWRHFGIMPDCVLGHSVGEFAAGVTAGLLSLENAMKLVISRTKLVQHLPPGSMLAVRTSLEQVTHLIKEFSKTCVNDQDVYLDIAAINSAKEVVVSGGSEGVKLFQNFCSNSSISTVLIQASHAFHSRSMEPVLPEFGVIAGTVSIGKLNCIYISGTLAKEMNEMEFENKYWERHLRDTVRFSDAIKLVWSECKVLVEIGSQPILLGLAMGNIEDSSTGLFCPSQRRNEEPTASFYTAMKRLYVSGVDFDWTSVYGIRQKCVTLPNYPFQRQKYWISDDAEEESDLNPELHPLLGKQFHSPLTDLIFHQMFRLRELSYIEDHKVAEHVVIPAAALLETFLAAGREVLQGGIRNKVAITIENFTVDAILPLANKCNIQTVVKSDMQSSEGGLKYQLSLNRKLENHFDKWKCHASAEFRPSCKIPEEKVLDLELLIARLEHKKTLETSYETLANIGIQFGPKFQSITSAWVSSTEILAEIYLPENAEDYICHPIVLDAMIQACGFREYISETSARAARTTNELFLPIGIRKFTWFSGSLSPRLFAHSCGDVGLVTLHNSNGEYVAVMEGLDLLKTTVITVSRAIRADSLEVPDFLTENWRQTLGKMDLRVDISKLTPTISSLGEKANKDLQWNIHREKLYECAEILNNYVFHSFLICIQVCNWTWRSPRKHICHSDWLNLLPKSLPEGLVGVYMNELESRGYLEYVEPGMFRIIKIIPKVSECEDAIQKIRLRIQSEIPYIVEDMYFLDRFRICLPQILQGKLTPLAYLFPENETETEYGAEFIYAKMISYKHLNILVEACFEECIVELHDSMAKGGVLRILEVGAGSGSTTELCIAALSRLSIPFQYTFTDTSSMFLTQAKKRMGQRTELLYRLFDIEKDPLSQGFSPGEFDIVIGVDVVHATVNVLESLMNLKAVLRTGGALILGELFEAKTGHLFVFGMLDGWWRFSDFRLKGQLTPLLNMVQWQNSLEKLEFHSISTVPGVYAGVVSAINGSRAKLEILTVGSVAKNWLVVQDSSKICCSVADNLRKFNRGIIHGSETTFEYYSSVLEKEANEMEGIIFCYTEFKSQNIVEIQNQLVSSLLNFLKAYEATIESYQVRPKIVVITRGVYSIGDTAPGDPNGATAWGMMKVFNNENNRSRITLIDLDPNLSFDETHHVFAELWNADDELLVAFRQNRTFVLRLNYMDKSTLPIQLPNTDRFSFQNPSSGAFSDIDFRPASQADPKGDFVEIEVRACSLNFRDLFTVMKPDNFTLPEGDGANSVGLDLAGVVVMCGPKVTRFQVGDEIFGCALELATTGGLGTHCQVSQNTLMRMPKNMTFSEASTIPIAFLTVLLSFIDAAKITPEDRVLIHIATGGVGLAAIQVAQSVGCEIFATAGSRRKRAYLKNIGIKYVYHSRNTSFGEEIARDTNGLGVTVVLNSLTGPNFKETSLGICSSGARFVEIAKLNIWRPEEVKILRPDVKYSIIDFNVKEPNQDKDTTRKGVWEKLTSIIEEHMYSGKFKALPYVSYKISKVRDAFYYFQKAKHIGKIVIEIPRRAIVDTGRIDYKHHIFNDKSTYLITGGLGGIGIEVTKWMQLIAAKTVVLVGRNPPAEKTQILIDDWNRQDSSIIVFQADIAEYTNCQRMLEMVKSLGLPPLRGIFHAAGVISDASVGKQTVENFEKTLRPKVYGGWYLHQLTLDYQIEFFVMFSSISGLVGMVGQCNHAAANRFLDSLAHYRVSMGLAGKTINFGGWSDIGAAATLGLTTDAVSGLRIFTPSQGIAALEKIMTLQDTQIGVSEVADSNLVKSMFGQGRYMDEIMPEIGKQNKLDQFDYHINEIKRAVSSEDRQQKIQSYIEVLLKQTLSLPAADVIDLDQNFSDLGVDSLMGMEMKNRLQSFLGEKTLSLSSMQENRSIRSISNHLAYLMENEPLSTRPVEELINEDAILSFEICPNDVPETIPSKCRNILLTGATGHLGINFIPELLSSPQKLTVYCLIRANSDAEAQDRLKKALDRYRISIDILKRVKVVAGDITKYRFGIGNELYEALARSIDGIIHMAAKVNHVDKYSDGSRHDMRTHNVHGLVNILKFAISHKTKSLLFASTLFAVTKITDTGSLDEEYPHKEDTGSSLNWGYLLSKFVGEKLVREATERGMPVTTIRFPVIFGNSETGYMPNGYNHVWSIILASIRVRMIPSDQLNGIPIIAVDSAAKVATQLFLSDSADRGIYNLTVKSTLSNDILKAGVQEYGVTCEFVPFQEWKNTVFEEHDEALLRPFKSLYQDTNNQSEVYSLPGLLRDMDKMNVSSFSLKMLKNLPHVETLVTSPEIVVKRQLEAHFQRILGN